ncbi:outer membrane transport energization protein ExbB [Kushneria sinocarnis]|uniref:Outer membrane transport energization protein ExbB n=1 Tax=Kushneria sinocarnis TaxID=595502 RepID=A0A420WYX0_9GAMM|nr:MotA/TolQ/ExbB proton channel family protein [Kushneria sinocarnis]RKR06335.1 outer membrane transport energization protein ExbB [Kushneria sinocarnis]
MSGHVGRRVIWAVVMMTAGMLMMGRSWAAPSLDQVVQQYQQQARAAEQRDSERLSRLLDNRDELRQAVQQAQQRLEQARERQQQLQQRRQQQQQALEDISQQRQSGSGDLMPVLDVLRQQIDRTRDELKGSWLMLGESDRLPQAIEEDAIPSLTDLQGYTDRMASLIAASGSVTRETRAVAGQDGSVRQRPVIRVGGVDAFSPPDLLQLPEQGQTLTVAEHTPGAAASQLADFAENGQGRVTVDPTQGDVLRALAQQPTLLERLGQGGVIGYVTLALGALGLLAALVQLGYLLVTGSRLRRQVRNLDHLQEDNPLGRVLTRFRSIRRYHDPEVLEARLDEMLLAEQPRLERGQALIKVMAAIAPLMGLLGTVTGMIGTFQSITVFGSGDPKVMAGGISQALVTTVIGLIVAIPLLFAHTALASRSRRLMNSVEGRASAALAEYLDRQEQSLAADVREHREREHGSGH